MAPRPANSPAAANSAQIEAASPRPVPAFRLPQSLAAAVERCWSKAGAPAEWSLTREQFEAALARSVAHRFGKASPYENSIEAYLESLNVRDLALARACSAGSPAAWEFFVAQFRPELYRAARAIVGNAGGDASARELADSLYADLYGLRESEGDRKSLFDYFHGRSKLGTWLRAVLAQRHVDEIRRARRTEPLENESGEERTEIAALASAAPGSAANAAHDPERASYLAILQATLTAALGSLEPRDRLRLAYYYADDRTLAEIGRLLGEHEATVSRKLERARREVRKRVEAALRDGKKWSDAQVNQCFEYARGEWPFDLSAPLRAQRSQPQPAEETSALPARD
ncbi:MAG: sigma-70 family RNA polymerase sigma factor [Candidatus Acidiferrales bacterium]|jgi:RNA polymerase sigma factor (sigma-70 family)